jgi:hypothetical protein
MSRTLSSAALKAIYSSETDEIFLILLTLDHDSLEMPIRVTSDAVPTRSREQDYIAFPFDLVLPDQTESRSPRARLTIDNVSREILMTLRQLQSPPRVRMEIIRYADPDHVEAVFPDFTLTNLRYNAMTIQGDLTIEDFAAEPYPAGIFSPAGFPGLF